MRSVFLMVVVGLIGGPGTVQAQAEKPTLELHSSVLAQGLPLPESAKGVYGFALTAHVNQDGEGKGTLELNPNAPTFDEFGFMTTNNTLPVVKLECTLKFVKKQTYEMLTEHRPGAPTKSVEWRLFAIQGPKLSSRLFLASHTDQVIGATNRLLVKDEAGKTRHAVDVYTPLPPQPCHPGCFPAGTLVQVPGGTKAVDKLRAGDAVLTVSDAGTPGERKVAAVFITRNRLVELRTDAGTLVTTLTQPLALAEGGFRAASELKPGDRVCRWEGSQRRPVLVQAIEVTSREAQVFNLVLGEPIGFVANGYLVRSKPPAP